MMKFAIPVILFKIIALPAAWREAIIYYEIFSLK